VYRAYPAELPVLSGGVAVPPPRWRECSPGSGLWCADVADLLPSGSVPAAPVRAIYVNGSRATRARTQPGDWGLTELASGYSAYPSIAALGNIRDVEIWRDVGWTSRFCPVDVVSGLDVTLQQPCWGAWLLFSADDTLGPAVSWMENALEFLDQPGEWYLDRASATLYYEPRSGESMKTASVVLPMLDAPLVEGSGTAEAPLRNVAFDGLAFAYNAWRDPSAPRGFVDIQATGHITQADWSSFAYPPAAVSFSYTQGLALENCQLVHLGAAALELGSGIQGASVTGNVIADVSANGIQLLGPADPADPRAFIADVRIENNLVTRVGAEYHGAVGIFSDWALRTVIAHNELRDLPYTAVSAGIGFELAELPSTGGYTIRENHVVDVMRDRFDGGGFYVLSNNPGSTVARNFVHRVPGGWPMYLEAGGKGWSIVENVFSEGQLPAPFDGWLVMNSLTDSPAPRDNEVAHNFADTDHIYTDSDGVAFGLNSVHDNEIHPDRDWPLDAQDIIAAAGLEPPYRTLAPSF